MNFTKSILPLAVSSAIFASLSASANEAQTSTDVEVITVTSDFRQQNLLKTPASLSVLTDIEINQRNAQHLEELVAVSPNVNFASGSQRARYYQIRGIGERSQFNEPINPSVGVIIDGIDFTGIGSIASLFDVQQAEIFRGPQGTRFGANALAGMINITTNAPTDEFEGAVKLDVGNYDSYGLGLALSGPASDTINYRLAANQYKSDGFIDNTYLGKSDTNNRDETSIRGKLSIQASQDLTIDLAAFYFDFDNGYDAFSLDNTRETLSDQPGFDRQETSAFSADFTYQGFEAFTLKALLSTADSDLAYGYDEDWAYVGISAPENIENQDFAYWEYSSTDHYFRDRSTQTVELRVISNSGSELFNGTTDWVAGLYFKQDDEDLHRQYTYLDNDFSSAFDTQTVAIYGQLDSQLNAQWSLTSGLRVEQRNADYKNSDPFIDNSDDTMIGGKLVLSYQQNSDSFWYGSINRGYKAGGANTDGSLPSELRTFDPEYLVNYELGYKVSLLDNAAFIRTAVFFMDRKDVQVKSSKTIVRGDGSSEFIAYLGNAATGSNMGIEVEANWQINDLVELYGSLGLLDTEFNDFINASGDSLSGREQAHAPNYQFNLGMNIMPSEYWLINISVDGKDEFYFSDSHTEKSDSVALVNASLSYLGDDYQVKLWARNLTDEDYANRGFYFGNDPRDGYTAKQYSQLAEPLVFGVTLDYQF
ncbi:MAG: TonB-dependent receptor [Colwellia sp.]|nr:TonB-dependent receptor [Colwellia sp.]MCW8865509.1 TonB-dependent receptor [Colwellia sp.]MCW9080970.1 TonB-dependent receptor [Colwellia sp.]